MAKRRSQLADPEIEKPVKRVTRSTASLTSPPLTTVDINGTPTKRSRQRVANQVNDQTDVAATAKPIIKKCEKRSSSDVLKLAETADEVDNDEGEPNPRDSPCRPQEKNDKSTRKRRRLVFDFVEIVSPRVTKRSSEPATRTRSPSPSPSARTPVAKKASAKTKSKPLEVHVDIDDVLETAPTAATPTVQDDSIDSLPFPLPVHLHDCLQVQKRATLSALQCVANRDTNLDADERNINAKTLRQVQDLLSGTIDRGEGNSCLIIGPSGSGKSKVIETALANFVESKPITVQLNGLVQFTDRLAVREIARQVVEQTGSQKFSTLGTEDDANPFDNDESDDVPIGSLPPPAHLPSLVAALPTLSRPVVVLLDAFDRFANQPRQALLYCLLDTVQSCRVGTEGQKGLAVIGLTSRVDVINTLEKRVKSRFSHRVLRTAGMPEVEGWIEFLGNKLCTKPVHPPNGGMKGNFLEWQQIWERSVLRALEDRELRGLLSQVFSISKDIRNLLCIMTSTIIRLDPQIPYLTAASIKAAIESQQTKSQLAHMLELNYPSLSLLIAAHHAQTAGQDTFSFEFLYDLFSTQVRASSAAPVMLGGGSIGMVNIGRRVLMAAFENLVCSRVFIQATNSSTSISKEFLKYRCTIERVDVKIAVDRAGQTSLKKWFNKAQ